MSSVLPLCPESVNITMMHEKNLVPYEKQGNVRTKTLTGSAVEHPTFGIDAAPLISSSYRVQHSSAFRPET